MLMGASSPLLLAMTDFFYAPASGVREPRMSSIKQLAKMPSMVVLRVLMRGAVHRAVEDHTGISMIIGRTHDRQTA
jgi:hypothetical protein